MKNLAEPGSTNSPKTNKDATVDGFELCEFPPSEELMLRVEQIFEEAEELWKWMYEM